METATDELLANAALHEADFEGPRAVIPSKHVVIVTCMDSRIDNFRIFGLDSGQAHILRNAGGLVSDDVLRSLVISQRLLGTKEIILIHHTDCGMLTFKDDALRSAIEAETGFKPPYALQAFDDLAGDVRAGIARIKADPHLLHRDQVRGFIFDVATGRLNEVT